MAEVLHGAVGTVHKAIPSADEPGRFFPYRARQWSDTAQRIRATRSWTAPHGRGAGSASAPVTTTTASPPSTRSRRDGIQIELMPKGGVYRRDTP